MMRRPTAPATDLISYGDLLEPSEAIEPILAGPVRGALTEWLTEIWAADDLRAVGLQPRTRALFYGPPGVGKTTLAHHLAARLGLPMLAVRPDRIIDCYIGSTGRNIGGLFDAAEAEGPVVLFFDEFEALANSRISVRQGADAERNSSLDVMLQRIDAHDGFVIAATNMAPEIDAAIWRRFDLQITLELPGQGERERILSRYLAPYGLPGPELRALADACALASPALLRQFCEGIKRHLVLGPKVGWSMRREDAVGRVLASFGPPPNMGKPRLWSHGVEDASIRSMSWPLALAIDLAARAARPPVSAAVVSLPGAGRRAS